MTPHLPRVIRIRTEDDEDEAAEFDTGPGVLAADEARYDAPAAPPGSDDEPVSIGDRIRKLLVSGGDSEPMYPRVLRLRHVHPNGWQRAALVEGMVILGAVAALADKATSWAPVVLPVAAAVVVKFHDVLAGVLPGRDEASADDASS